MLTCKECGAACTAANSLSYHLRGVHGMTYLEYVVKHEHGGEHPTCKCGAKLPLKKGGFTRFCCRSCASSGEDNPMGRLKGELSPNFGKKRTKEQRANYVKGAKKRWDQHGDRIREMMRSPEYKAMQSEAQREANRKNPELKAKRIAGLRKFWSSDSDRTRAARKAASDRAIVMLEQQKIGPRAPYRCGWVPNPFTGRDEYMHSSWETAFLERCVAEGVPVTKDHGVRIPYVDELGAERQYVPDFVVVGTQTLFEVKGHLTARDELKLRAAESAGWEAVLVLGVPAQPNTEIFETQPEQATEVVHAQ